MVLNQIFYRVAFIVTAFVHLYFNDLIKATIVVAAMCLSDSKRPVLQSILRLHSVVLVCFMLAFCFSVVSAHPDQTILNGRDVLMWFDDVETPHGFGQLAAGYHGFTFNYLYAFKPTHQDLEGTISGDDLNCAISKPNALYGSKVAAETPSIHAHDPSRTFTVHSLKIKPLDFPVGFVTINLRGFLLENLSSPLEWTVDYPAGFHDTLHVRLEEFSKTRWKGLTRLEVEADFHYNNVEMDDWEFCIDDLEIEIE
ncbi:hypothetical protein A1O7_09716 [Cladophialophora yegresii CBS 114405]|uniref:Uncharacterized protein n=1 Tax=Cladophialophora yegresii CBS 114405 TaxID=1182544 RepID=W9VFK2_9EURO|nr:uncharacterized protein A1O7_09716 [Cladophialophora yegresii CBS 114405]EXJ54377.1 hypothetical protein A1O7_09716 [Cladophialophora yegresii CBS 114405]